jgi:hypothetical protein
VQNKPIIKLKAVICKGNDPDFFISVFFVSNNAY